LAISSLEATLSVKETSTQTNKDVKEVLVAVTENRRLFLTERIGLRDDCDEEMAADLRLLARELGGLPLAAEQAGAYLSQNRWITPGDYTARMVENLNHGGTAPLDYDRTVYATFSLALDAIVEEIEEEHRQWVAQDPDDRKFGPPSPITGATA